MNRNLQLFGPHLGHFWVYIHICRFEIMKGEGSTALGSWRGPCPTSYEPWMSSACHIRTLFAGSDQQLLAMKKQRDFLQKARQQLQESVAGEIAELCMQRNDLERQDRQLEADLAEASLHSYRERRRHNQLRQREENRHFRAEAWLSKSDVTATGRAGDHPLP